ncbi:MAG: ROK family protein [Clostridiales Family XIII bacterium]|jgi:hypothetical protein|nr:ROK family protein [Clostridiales Family XIII bacterium]
MDTNLIKDTNLRNIRKIIRGKGSFTKPELAKKSGLSTMTVGSLINELAETGEVIVGEAADNSIGRKATLYSYNPEFKLILTVALFERKKQLNFVFSVQNLYGEILEQSTLDGENKKVQDLNREIANCKKRFANIQAVVVGIPGVVANDRLSFIDFPQLADPDFKKILQEGTSLEIYIINDANAALYGYAFDRNEDGTIAGVYYPDNYRPGAAVMIDGEVLVGRNGLVGEITHNLQDWQKYSPKSAEEYLTRTVQEFICYYDPDKIVIFHHDLFDGSVHKAIEEMMDSEYPYCEKPETVLLNNFDLYYIRGLCFYAINKIL